jgi:hypothetical protein
VGGVGRSGAYFSQPCMEFELFFEEEPTLLSVLPLVWVL